MVNQIDSAPLETTQRPLLTSPPIELNLDADLDAMLDRVVKGDTSSLYGYRRRLAEIAEEHGMRYVEITILMQLRLKLHVKEGRYSDEQLETITVPELRSALGLS